MERYEKPVLFSLLIPIFLLYATFLWLDVTALGYGLSVPYLKYASIVLCLILGGTGFVLSINKHDSAHVFLALSLTVVADAFLLLYHRHTVGIFVFMLVQLIYIKRYDENVFKKVVWLVPIALILNVFGVGNPRNIFALTYGALILTTFVTTFKTTLPMPNVRYVQIGMVLFILCDIHVALFNILPRSASYFGIASVAIWFFYVPAQVLLALSGWHLSER